MKFRLGILILLVVGITGCGDDEIQNVLATISGINPAQVSLGQQGIEGKINGNNFSGVSAVSLGSDIAVDSFSVVSATEISVRFSVSGSAAPGQRTISITNAAGTATANVLNVINNKAPLANFSVNPPAGSRATEFELDGSESRDTDGSVQSYRWDFADGTSANGRKVKHKWNTLGTFDVKLTVTDNDNATGTAGREVEILNDAPPVAVIKVKPGTSGSTLTDFEFDGSESYDPEGKKLTSFLWDFGDGTRKQTDKLAFHKYKNQGNYTVTLSVTDNKGLTGSDSRGVAVEKVTEVQCRGGLQGRNPDVFIKILSVTGHDVVFKSDKSNASCSNLYYKCGDIRQGGIRHKPERWYGTICQMWDRGDGTFRARLRGGNAPIDPTAPEIYLHSQRCRPSGGICG